MLIEHIIKFNDDGSVTVAQRVEPGFASAKPVQNGGAVSGSLTGSFLTGKGAGGGENTAPGGGGGENTAPGGGGGENTAPGGGGGENTAPGGGGGGAGAISVVILGAIVVGTPNGNQSGLINSGKGSHDFLTQGKEDIPGTFQMEKQLEDKWCWAAVSVSVDRYFAPKSTSTQCGLAADVLGVPDCCTNPQVCNTPARLQTALSVVGNLKSILERPLQFHEIRREIDARRPVCIRIGWNSGGGHFVVISGYQQSASGVQMVEVSDPLFPNSIVPYDVLLSAYQNAQEPLGGGQWKATFLVEV